MRARLKLVDDLRLDVLTFTVCVSSLMIQEIKRIIKDSEIMKYDGYHYTPQEGRMLMIMRTEKTTPNGHKRTKTVAKNWRSD